VILQSIPLVLLSAAAVSAVRTLVTKLRARSDLSAAIVNSGPESTTKIRQLVAKDDVAAVIDEIRGHLSELPARERQLADDALSQPSVSGRRSYAQSVVAQGLKQQDA
jgi:predicted phage gp36 major capsid-like protein